MVDDNDKMVIVRTSTGVPKGHVVFLRRISGAQTDIVVGVHKLHDVSSGVVVISDDISSIHYSSYDFTIDQLIQTSAQFRLPT